MVNKFLILFLLLGLGSISHAQQTSAALTVFVDRNEVLLNDVIILTIRMDSQLGDSTPSLNGLNRDFEQLGISRTNTYTNNNGVVQSWSEHRVSIRGKTTGTFTIPALRVGGLVSNPIQIVIGEPSANSDSGTSDIFLSTSVSKENIYVQEQLLYTVKLYFSVSFDQGAQLTAPQVANSVVQQLGSDETYQEIIDGIRFNVNERKFVVYPQSSGELIIPPVYFTATVGRRRNGLSRILNNRTASPREINLSSESHLIEVMTTPPNFPGSSWLPAADFTIEEEWSGDLDNLEIGESITRNVVMRATGLSSSLIPGFEYPEIANIKFYPDQPLREDSADNNGIIGLYSEGTAIVPSESGEFTIPEISIPWWNTVEDRLETATIPARTLSVMAAANSSEPILAALDPTQSITNINNENSNTSEGVSNVNLYWIIATLLFASAWIITTIFWLRNKSEFTSSNSPLITPNQAKSGPTGSLKGATAFLQSQSTGTKAAFSAFKQACQQTDQRLVKQSLLAWAQAYFGKNDLLTFDHIRQQSNNPELSEAMSELEQRLYSESTESSSNSERLFAIVSMIHKNNNPVSQKSKPDYRLPPLYKN